MHLMLAALLLAAAASDPGEPPPRCEDMRRLSDAANRAGSFRALIDAGFAPPILYGCRPADGGYRCWRNVTPPEVTPVNGAMREIARLPFRPGGTTSVETREKYVSWTPSLVVSASWPVTTA